MSIQYNICTQIPKRLCDTLGSGNYNVVAGEKYSRKLLKDETFQAWLVQRSPKITWQKNIAVGLERLQKKASLPSRKLLQIISGVWKEKRVLALDSFI